MNPNKCRAHKDKYHRSVTGASGALLAQKALVLLEDDARVARVHLVVTETGHGFC